MGEGREAVRGARIMRSKPSSLSQSERLMQGSVALLTKMRQSEIWILNVPFGHCMRLCLGSFGF